MKQAILGALIAPLLGIGAAQAQVVGDPDVVQNLMQTYGLQVTQDTDSVGDPMLSTRIEGTNFDVYFYSCEEGPCQSIQFSAGFDLDQPMSASTINEWNRDKRFGKAFLDDEGDPHIEYDINLDHDGIGAKNFDDTIDLWRVVLADFRDFIDW